LLLRGSAIAGIGALILLIAGATVPPQDLSIWGWPIIIVSFGLIAIGLIPYRRLSRLEDKPSKLVLTDDNEIIYIVNDRKRVTIPYDSIEKMEYLKNSNIYGIGLWLKKNNNLKPVVHDPLFNAIGHQKIAQKRFGCDLFLPFFSERALAELQ
jgi:hypothetical protein